MFLKVSDKSRAARLVQQEALAKKDLERLAATTEGLAPKGSVRDTAYLASLVEQGARYAANLGTITKRGSLQVQGAFKTGILENFPGTAAYRTAVTLLMKTEPSYVGGRRMTGNEQIRIGAINTAAALLIQKARAEHVDNADWDYSAQQSNIHDVADSEVELHVWKRAVEKAKIKGADPEALAKNIVESFANGTKTDLDPKVLHKIAHALLDAAASPKVNPNEFLGKSAPQSRIAFRLNAIQAAAHLLLTEVAIES
jgi:hypothetical protein